MSESTSVEFDGLDGWMASRGVGLWGAADLSAFPTPPDPKGRRFPAALSLVFPMNPCIMESIRGGPNQAYADAYARVNQTIDAVSAELVERIRGLGFRAMRLAASARTDPVNVRGDFPHKTAATRAGLGWIGRHCQLITRRYGPWVRLGTVFTDLPLPAAKPAERSFCGSCTACVDACPAKALTGEAWRAGLPREAMLDVAACDRWKKTHYFQYHKGHNCGICASVCPYGLKLSSREPGKDLLEPG